MTQKMEGQRHERSALLLYGSETGNSQDVAEELGRVAERLHFATRVSEMDGIEISHLLKYSVVILVVATTGQGEFPRNARKFWKSLLRKRLPAGCLDHVSFTTFGLGDSSYPKYNWSARKLHKRLEQLGAKEIYPRGEADEQHPEGIHGTFLSWAADLREHLLSSYPLPDGVVPIPQEVLLPPKFLLELLETASKAATESNNEGPSVHLDQPNATLIAQPQISNSLSGLPGRAEPRGKESDMDRNPDYDPLLEEDQQFCSQLKHPLGEQHDPVDAFLPPSDCIPIPSAFCVKLVENKRVTPETHWQDVRLLTFLMEEDSRFEPGDVMEIFPKNFPEDVQELIDLMEWNDVADKPLKFVPTFPDYYRDPLLVSLPPTLHPLPDSTLRQLLTHNLDITAIPKRYFFDLISHFTNDEMHRERLLEFSNPAFTDEFFDYTSRPRRSILEVLADFPSVKLPFSHAISVFPIIRGRQFSICNGGLLKRSHDDGLVKVQLLVAMVKYKTILKKIRQGLCSRYIASLEEDMIINVKLHSNPNFYRELRRRPDLPVIMIAAGTGIAPCRSLIWHRCSLSRDEYDGEIGPHTLIYGGRNRLADYFFGGEWKSPLLKTKVFTAFSRDQKEKIYVQDVIRKEGKYLAQLMKRESAVIYVCGSSGNMPKAVQEALLDIIVEHTEIETREQAEEKFEIVKKHGFYIQETW